MGFKERMQGDPDEWYYTTAWGLLRCNWDFQKLKDCQNADYIKKHLQHWKLSAPTDRNTAMCS